MEKAVFQLEKALEMPVYNRSDEKFITNYNLGRTYKGLKDSGKALQCYKKAAALNPFYAPTYNNIGGLMEREGKYERSYRCLIRALKLDPGDPTVNYNLGIHYLKEGQPDRAILYMKKAAGVKAFRGKALLYMGIAYKQKGQLGRAFTYFTKTAREGTGDITPHLHLAEVFQRAGHADKAGQEAEKVLRMIRGKDMFDKMLGSLTKRDRSSRLRPSAAIIIPLLRDACLSKADDLKEWVELLSEREGLQRREKQKTGR